jgi:hypothetical protein
VRVSNYRRGRGRLLLGLIVVLLVVMVAVPASANRVCYKAYAFGHGQPTKTCVGPGVSGWSQDEWEHDHPSGIYGVGVWWPTPPTMADDRN